MALVPFAIPAAVIAQQPGNAAPPSYPQQPPAYQAPAYQAPPANYPPPNYQQQPSYQQPPGNAQRPQNYPPPSNNQAAPGYYQQPAAVYPPPAAVAPAPQAAPGAAGDQVAPYHVHRDLNHGHDHVYPDRGSVVRDLPHGSILVNYAGMSYQFAEGVWFEPRGPAWLVVEPPIGLVVPTLPQFMTPLNTGTEIILYANDTFYRPRPDIGGYEVVNDPIDSPVQPAAAGGAAVAAAAPAAVAAAAPPPAPAPAKTADQQARDQYECYRFAVSQTGFDPIRTSSGQAGAQLAGTQQSNYERAHSACLEGRGYPAH